MVIKRTRFLALFSFIAISACGGGSNDAAVSLAELDEAEKALFISNVQQRAAEDGVKYDYAGMTAVFEEEDGMVRMYFVFDDPNARGGSPEATMSRDNGEIVNIHYTR